MGKVWLDPYQSGKEMNERIKELAEQCWDRRLDGLHFDQEMFAELIVLECLDIVDEEVSGMLGVHVMKKIAEHFGIKS
jgi:hypothetical protein